MSGGWMGPGVECSWKPQHSVFCHITGLPSNVKHAWRTTELMFETSMPGCEQVGLSESQKWFAGSLLFLLFFVYFTFCVSLLCPLVINHFLNVFSQFKVLETCILHCLSLSFCRYIYIYSVNKLLLNELRLSIYGIYMYICMSEHWYF